MIFDKNVKDVVEENIADYYEEIIVNRAIPDIRDSLKPVQRRIIYSMFDSGFKSSGSFVKSATVVGNVIGHLNPHGDQSAYEALVGLTKNWMNNQILLHPHGSFGDQYGNEYASYRYTEIKLNKFTEENLLQNLNDNSVDFIDNFDKTMKEPSVLPCRLPLLLINGSFGIGGGYMTSIPTHNINDVTKKTIELIKNPNIPVEEFAKDFLPSFPTGAIICNPQDIYLAYTNQEKAIKSKKSNIIIRSRLIKDEKNNCIKITEIPFMKTLETILDSIKDAVKDKMITGIKNIKDGSTKGYIDVTIECFKGEDLDLIINQLYKFTLLQTTLPIVLVACNNNKFVIYNNIKDIFTDWIKFRVETIKRIKTEYIRKMRYRIHILDGLLIALHPNNIDKLIKIVRTGDSKQDIIDTLIETFDLTDIQAKYIVELQLYRLNKLQIKELEDEKKDLESKVEAELIYFTDKKAIDNLIISELQEINKKYSTKATTTSEEVDLSESNATENLITDEDFLMILTKNNYLKKIQCDISSQKKAGLGKGIGNIKEDDIVKSIIKVNSKDTILFFTDNGKVYGNKCYEIDKTSLKSYGVNLSKFVKDNEKVVSIINVTSKDLKDTNNHLLIATKKGLIKMTSLSEYTRIGSGIIASKLNEDDEIMTVQLVNIKDEFTVFTVNNEGTAIHISKDDIPIIKRTTFGSNIFKPSVIQSGKRIINCVVINKNIKEILLVMESGLGKRVPIEEFAIQKRCGIGMLATRLKTDKDRVAQCLAVEEGMENLMIISNTSIINIPIDDVAISKRPAYGYTLKKLTAKEKVIDACLI